jgi:hypothetical protein
MSYRKRRLLGPAIAQAGSRRPGFEPMSRHVGFVVHKVAPGQVYSKYFGFPCQFSIHWLLQIQHNLLSRADKIGQIVADVPSELSLTPPRKTKKSR